MQKCAFFQIFLWNFPIWVVWLRLKKVKQQSSSNWKSKTIFPTSLLSWFHKCQNFWKKLIFWKKCLRKPVPVHWPSDFFGSKSCIYWMHDKVWVWEKLFFSFLNKFLNKGSRKSKILHTSHVFSCGRLWISVLHKILVHWTLVAPLEHSRTCWFQHSEKYQFT